MAKKILIAEDEEISFFKEIFEGEGYEVIYAEDGLATLRELKHHQPEILLLDLRLPKVDGIEILKEMKERKVSPKTRVIIWTGFDNYGEPERTISENYSEQVSYYLKKPISLDDLLGKVRNLMSKEKDTDS